MMVARTPPRGHRLFTTIALVMATIGVVVPFGIASDKTSNAMSPLEWVLAALGVAALIGLIIELVGLAHYAWPFMLTGLVWAVITVYVVVSPRATFLWHLGTGLMAGAFAVLALTAWRIEARGGPGV